MRVEDAEPKGIDQRPAQQSGAGMNTEVGAESFYRSDGIGAVERAGFENRDAVRSAIGRHVDRRHVLRRRFRCAVVRRAEAGSDPAQSFIP